MHQLPDQTHDPPPRPDTHHLTRHTTPFLTRLPSDQTHHPPGLCRDTVKRRSVRILLECILVWLCNRPTVVIFFLSTSSLSFPSFPMVPSHLFKTYDLVKKPTCRKCNEAKILSHCKMPSYITFCTSNIVFCANQKMFNQLDCDIVRTFYM